MRSAGHLTGLFRGALAAGLEWLPHVRAARVRVRCVPVQPKCNEPVRPSICRAPGAVGQPVSCHKAFLPSGKHTYNPYYVLRRQWFKGFAWLFLTSKSGRKMMSQCWEKGSRYSSRPQLKNSGFYLFLADLGSFKEGVLNLSF